MSNTYAAGNDKQAIRAILDRRYPGRIVYGPNYWQWHSHHRRHATLPEEIAHLETQLQLLEYLGVDVVSRNTYCSPAWWYW